MIALASASRQSVVRVQLHSIGAGLTTDRGRTNSSTTHTLPYDHGLVQQLAASYSESWIGSAVEYFTCLRAKLDRMPATHSTRVSDSRRKRS